VWCDAPAHVLRQRFSRRWHVSHAIHGAEPDDQEWAQMLEHGAPLALGPVLRVDTTTQVDITAVAAWCRANACTTENELTKSGSSTLQIERRDEGPARSRPELHARMYTSNDG
jgi:hypothetical protein